MANQPNAAHNLWRRDLEVALLPLDVCPIECEALSQVISRLLIDAGVPHQVMRGYARDMRTLHCVIPHVWICLPDGFIIDLRLRMWLGDRDCIPHGIFPEAGAGIAYHGSPDVNDMLDLDTIELYSEGRAAWIVIPRIDKRSPP